MVTHWPTDVQQRIGSLGHGDGSYDHDEGVYGITNAMGESRVRVRSRVRVSPRSTGLPMRWVG